MNTISPEIQKSLFVRMLKVRLFEEKVVDLYADQQMRCPVHLSIGQEATSAGLCEALHQKDLIFGNHRSHGHYVAKGGNLRKMLAEMYGKVTGCGRGVGGSMHLIDMEAGVVATTPIVGSTIPISVGAALANQMKKDDRVTVLFLGDAAVEEGVFHESLNFAILKRLPMIFFCENNFYSVYTHLKDRQPHHRSITDFVKGHGIPASLIDGNNVLDVYQASQNAYEMVKAGKGPVFIEAVTYRWREHCGPNFDNHIGYRTEEEYLVWKEKCPIQKMTDHLLQSGIASSAWIEEEKKKIEAEIDDAVRFAQESPFPPQEQLFENIYAQ